MEKQKIEMSRTRQAKCGNFEQCNNLGIKARLNILSTQRSKVKHTILNKISESDLKSREIRDNTEKFS